MQRSGTSLVEQILSSHSKVGGVGEQGFWLHHRGGSKSEIEQDQLKLDELGSRYLGLISNMRPGKRRIVDKMPDRLSGAGGHQPCSALCQDHPLFAQSGGHLHLHLHHDQSAGH